MIDKISKVKFDLRIEELKHVVSEPYFSRGVKYFENGYVRLDEVTSTHVKARVLGTTPYYVTFKRAAKGLRIECSCPAFCDFGPCKHIAAAGLAILQYSEGGYQPSPEFEEDMLIYESVEKNLRKFSKEELIQEMMRFLGDDPELLYEYSGEE